VKQGNRVISYCHIGQQATLVYFVAKYLGYESQVYDGSFEEWSGRKDLPLVNPAAPTPSRR
jgi:thiosulfate/3-mercaptopyruvate sulfurtransferase